MPSSIFVRIYGGLLLVITLVAGCTYYAVQGINDYRAEDYREDMATGVFHLIALGASRQPAGPARDSWLAEASRLMDTDLSVVPPAKQAFTSSEYERMSKGRAIIRVFPNQNFADIYARLPGQPELYIRTRMSKVSEQQAKALAVFFVEELAHYPQQEDRRIKELLPYFGFPVTVDTIDKAALDADQTGRVKRNEVVLVLHEGAGTRNSSVRIVAALENQPNKVLLIGPLFLFDWMPMQLLIIASVAGLLIITIGAYLIVHPLERKLKMMEQTVRRIRGGDLSARAEVDGSDEIGQLAKTFNGMAEHIQRLIDSQRELTRAVSHELRTPVARLRFGMEMLADTDDIEQRHEQLGLLDRDVEQLNQLIDEILTYAKLEQGTPSLKFEMVDLSVLIQRVRRETQALGSGVSITTLPLPVGTQAEAEQRYLHRVLQNLAGNAVRYARSNVRLSGGVRGNWAYVRVEDDGPGIPEKDRERIFKPFARLDDSRTRSSGGYGLGLSIVQRICFWHGGTIEVAQSQDMGGAMFTMRWPVQQSLRLSLPEGATVADAINRAGQGA
jgi:two-component system sensor histidine kinase RstB